MVTFPFQGLWTQASIGFIELFELAVGNGIILTSYINQLRNDGTGNQRTTRLSPAAACVFVRS